MSVIKTLTLYLLLSAAIPSAALGGTWGQENWGQMYWGDNPVSAPLVSPQVESVSVDGDTITFQISEYTAGQDGWSAIQSYSVSCGEGVAATTTDQTLVVTGLNEETQYTCEIIAENAAGESAPLVQEVATEALQRGLPIWLLYEASKGRT